jgi:hypothetical protein
VLSVGILVPKWKKGKMKKMVMAISLAGGLLGFAFVSMAQGASDGKLSCDYLTVDEVSSILGPVVSQSLGSMCIYRDSRNSDNDKNYMAGLSVIPTDKLIFDRIYQASLANGAKSIEFPGGLAWGHEVTDPDAFVVSFCKNGNGGIVQAGSQDKAEALAKLLASKLF